MKLTFLFFVCIGLLGIVILQLFYIHKLQKKHANSIHVLNKELFQIQSKTNKNNYRVATEENFKQSLKLTQTKLNKEVFDLQMSMFDKMFGHQNRKSE
jgi:hypothetical protein